MKSMLPVCRPVYYSAVACMGVLAWGPNSNRLLAAEARATAVGSTCNVHQVDQHEGTSFATAVVNDSHSSGSAWEAHAGAIQSGDGPSTLAISAFAKATPPPEFNENTFQCRCGASATASIYDELTITNPNVLVSLPNNVLVFTLPIGLDGKLDWDGSDFRNSASVEFRSSIATGGPSVGGWPTYSSFVYDSNKTEGDVFKNGSPAIGVNMANPKVTVSMRLSVEAIAWPGTGISYSNFSQTAKTFPIIVSDIYGNPVPGSEQLQIVGLAGTPYRVQTIPEPTTLVSMVVLFGLLPFWCSLRSYSRH